MAILQFPRLQEECERFAHASKRVLQRGEVMDDPHGTNVYYIWYGDWSSDPAARTIVTDFISNVGASAYFNINNSYFDANKDGERVTQFLPKLRLYK